VIRASDAGDDQVLVERSFQFARVGSPQDSVGAFYIVRKPDSRLGFIMSGKPVVEVAAQSEVDRPISFAYGVLRVQRELLYIGMPFEEKGRAAGGQIECRQ